MIASGGGLSGAKYHDLTLSGLSDAAPHARPADWRGLCELIGRFHPCRIEIVPSQVAALEGFDRARLCLRVSSPEAVLANPGFGAYALPVPAPLPGAPRGCGWLRLMDGDGPSHRLSGPDRPLGGAALKKILALQSALPGGLQYCSTDGRHLATGNAVSFLLSGGRYFAAAFGGVGGVAPTEEILMTLTTRGALMPDCALQALPEIRDTIEAILGKRFAPDKPVLGRRVFQVESGVHVDGLLKDERLYEPYPPGLVGQKRAIVIGKHSGRTSVAAKLREEGAEVSLFDLEALLRAVKERCQRLGRSLTDEEFIALSGEFCRVT